MKVLFDHQIFVEQKFGGISRYFNQLFEIGKGDVQVERINPDLFAFQQIKPSMSLVARAWRKASRKLGVKEVDKSRLIPQDVVNVFYKADFDLLHPTYYNPYFLTLTDKPFVLTVYDMIHEIYKEYFPLNDLVSHHKLTLCNKAAAIIAISHKTKQDLISIFGIEPDKIHVTHLASDFDQYAPVKPVALTESFKYILFVGARGGYKNFYYATRALADLLKKDTSLHLLCSGHPFTAEELMFFADLGISNQMKQVFLKDDSELAWAYAHAELFIFPSLYEGFGLPILEAFASGCPVISSNGGSLPEVGGDAALYFNPKVIEEIKQAAASVLYDKAVRETLVSKGKERFKQFSWDKCRSETVSVYRKVLGK